MESHHSYIMIFVFIILICVVIVIGPDKKEKVEPPKCPVCDIEKVQKELDRQMYLKMAFATRKYCSANWFDGSEVCQHLETECFNYCIKTAEKNCRIECESRI